MRMPRRQVTTIKLKPNPGRKRSQWEVDPTPMAQPRGVLWETRIMKKPFLRVTKWLGDIPVEAICIACGPEPLFRVAPTSHRPNREEYANQLQRAFDRHCKTVHADEAQRAEPGS